MKQAVTGIINKIPASDASHTHGWARVWADNLGIELNDHDEKVSSGANLSPMSVQFRMLHVDLSRLAENRLRYSSRFHFMHEFGVHVSPVIQ